jgi:hypothetical protein
LAKKPLISYFFAQKWLVHKKFSFAKALFLLFFEKGIDFV